MRKGERIKAVEKLIAIQRKAICLATIYRISRVCVFFIIQIIVIAIRISNAFVRGMCTIDFANFLKRELLFLLSRHKTSGFRGVGGNSCFKREMIFFGVFWVFKCEHFKHSKHFEHFEQRRMRNVFYYAQQRVLQYPHIHTTIGLERIREGRATYFFDNTYDFHQSRISLFPACSIIHTRERNEVDWLGWW